ncbi:MAG: pyruvate kinase [Acidobacteriota bacterium]
MLQNARPGQPIWFDDGAIGAVVEKQEAEHIVVRITHTHVGGGKLRADKGINLPETDFTLDALTDKDVEDLAFASQHADIVELSFANTVTDVQRLQQYLVEAGERRPGIVLKIETRRGFRESAGDVTGGDALAGMRHHDRPRRPGGGVRFRTHGGGAGRDPVDLRSGARFR